MKKTLFATIAAMLLSVPQADAQLNMNDSVKFITGANAEYASILNYMKRAMRFTEEVPQEKVYLHFDNTVYFHGETIWFKAYVVNAGNMKPTELSRVLYVELVSPIGDIVKTQKLYVKDGEAEGSIRLEKIFDTGFYEVRAYTRYMTNWGNAAIFSRVFPVFKEPKKEGDYSERVLNTYSYKSRMLNNREIPQELLDETKNKKGRNDNIVTAKTLPKGKINVSFYPEGGNLIENVPCRVAFNVVDSEGRHFDTEGMILNSRKETVGATVTLEKGRGFLDVTSDGKPMYLRLVMADGKTQDFLLPEAEREGVGLVMNTLRDDFVTAQLNVSRSLNGRLLGYVVMNNGRITYADTITSKERFNIKFDRKSIPAGVNQFIVFDSDGRVHSDRLFFICPPADAADSIFVTTKQKVIQPCGKVKLDIQSRPDASISLSAMDIATLTNGNESNARSWMLLSSEVKGFIEHPDYYFEADDLSHRRAADLLMMVQGWRRHRWQLMEGEEEFRKVQFIEDSLYISGKVLSRRGKYMKPNVDLDVYLFRLDTQEWLKGSTRTDSLGNYAFATPNMDGNWSANFITKENGKKSRMRVTVDRNFSPMRKYLSPYETDEQPMLISNFMKDTPDSLFKSFDDIPLVKRDKVLPDIKVNARRRIFDGARAAWESEAQGEKDARIYYDMVAETQKVTDEGKTIPGLFDWLFGHNPNFTGMGKRFLPTKEESNFQEVVKDEDVPDAELDDEQDNEAVEVDDDESISEEKLAMIEKNGQKKGKFLVGKSDELRVKTDKKKESQSFDYEMGYNGRPIVWMLDNSFYAVTSSNLQNMNIHTLRLSGVNVVRPNIFDPFAPVRSFPTFIDEVSAIYISESPWYGIGSSVRSTHPVTIYVYTHVAPPVKIKGHVFTTYHAFDKVDTFHSEDYSILPPMEDYRRTVFWAPDVRTDKDGKATVEFYNNSSARRLYISAEGMTKDGHILVNE